MKEPGKTRAGFMPTSRTGGEATASGGEDKGSSQGPRDTLLATHRHPSSPRPSHTHGPQHKQEHTDHMVWNKVFLKLRVEKAKSNLKITRYIFF